MKIASNKLSDLYTFYKNELSSMYDEEELYAVFELVCEKYLTYAKEDVKQHFNANVNQSDVIKIYDAAKALKTGMPVQYILKEAFFYDSLFYVTPSVLIPRPETEELVDLIIKDSKINKEQNLKIIDIGTGSGCIPITLKKHLSQAEVFGIDISKDALGVAKKNANNYNLNVDFQICDILKPLLLPSNFPFSFSIIVSNPPYIAHTEAQHMENRVLDYEPHIALFVEDNDPIIFYKRIIDLCEKYLSSKGLLYFELNPLFALDVKNYANTVNFFNFTELITDMSGKTRFLKAQKK